MQVCVDLLEYSKKNVDEFYQEISATNYQKVKDQITGTSFSQKDWEFSVMSLSFQNLIKLHHEFFRNNLKHSFLYDFVGVVIWVLGVILASFFVWSCQIKSLYRHIARIKGMIGLIPAESLLKDSKIKKQFLKNKFNKFTR